MTNRALHGLTALVTGGGHGIGAGIATLFASHGAKVVIGDISSEFASETVDKIRAAGNVASALVGDVSTRAGSSRLVEDAAKTYGRLDILVHNAGIYPQARFEDISDDVLKKTFDVNLMACFWLAQAALPLLEKSPSPRIIITSSGGGNSAGVPGLTHYAASKGGVSGFVRNLAIELAPRRITVNSVEPGLILTEHTRQFFDEAAQRRMAEIVPLGRPGSPADIANAMLFFALPQSDYVTGQCLAIEGGLNLVEPIGSAMLRAQKT